MFKVLTSLVLVTALAGAGFGTAGIVCGSTDRADCPGKIVCPINGELVCQDRCRLGEEARADCPGKIDCRITDERICKDRCPFGKAKADQPVMRPCCMK